MQANGSTVAEILANIPDERKGAFTRLHETILDNLPEGFEPGISYGGLGYVVPHSVYPAGYHCKPSEPLPFAGIASQKNSINFYHMGIYADPKLFKWFQEAHAKASPKKLDMGKSCIRYKKPEDIPFKLIGELAAKMSMEEWIEKYESMLKGGSRKSK